MESKMLVIFLVVIPFIQSRQISDPITYDCTDVDGGWTEWSNYSPCSVSCGKGLQTRYRYCAAPVAKYGGQYCEGQGVEITECDALLECPVDGGWSDYVKGDCSVTCGGGTVTYTRTCNNPTPQYCGKDCEGEATYVEECNTHDCPVWSEWNCTACYKKPVNRCIQKCTRTCIYFKNDKDYCDGHDTEYRDCAHDICYPNNPEDFCNDCYDKAIEASNHPDKPSGFVGLACRAPGLADFCKTADLSINGGHPANHWFWIHCSPDGPWCKPCATRGLVFNKNCDACETTRDGPCTGKHPIPW